MCLPCTTSTCRRERPIGLSTGSASMCTAKERQIQIIFRWTFPSGRAMWLVQATAFRSTYGEEFHNVCSVRWIAKGAWLSRKQGQSWSQGERLETYRKPCSALSEHNSATSL